MTRCIIHITGPSGSGKTTLGKKLISEYGNRFIIVDMDDIRKSFIKQYYGSKRWTYINEIEYQKYIYKFIESSKKHVVFVGLNDNILGKNKNLYYDLRANHKYYIQLDDKTIIKQKCLRLLNDIREDDIAMDYLVNNNSVFVKKFSEAVKRECDLTTLTKMITKWKKDYKKQGYAFMAREDIYKSVKNLLDKL
jgi:adenylate kinase family enzyme